MQYNSIYLWNFISMESKNLYIFSNANFFSAYVIL